jgi:hypothetical protein
MSHSHSIVARQLIECRPEKRFLARKLCRGAHDPALVADHYKPESDGPRVVPRSSVKRGNLDFVPVIKNMKVFLLEISDRQPGFGILTDDINDH